jgi:hypothetical protein
MTNDQTILPSHERFGAGGTGVTITPESGAEM